MAALLAPSLQGFGSPVREGPQVVRPPQGSAGVWGQDLEKAQGKVSALSGRLGKVFQMAGVDGA